MPSTVIRRFSYDEETRTLVITFVSGQRYAYAGVPPEVHADMRAAFSKGRFFAAHVRDHYRYRRLDDGDEGPPPPGLQPADGPRGPRPGGPASPPLSSAVRSDG